jgi:GNAT superfamily N-acetyltransferase
VSPEWRRPGPQDGPALAEIRAAAMRPTLEAVGRFDPERARRRFLDGYDPADTAALLVEGTLAGVLVVRDRGDHLYLDHLYIRPDLAGRGLGSAAVQAVQARARAAGLPVRLCALRESPANGFYVRHGFRFERAEGWDNLYRWP